MDTSYYSIPCAHWEVYLELLGDTLFLEIFVSKYICLCLCVCVCISMYVVDVRMCLSSHIFSVYLSMCVYIWVGIYLGTNVFASLSI